MKKNVNTMDISREVILDMTKGATWTLESNDESFICISSADNMNDIIARCDLGILEISLTIPCGHAARIVKRFTYNGEKFVLTYNTTDQNINTSALDRLIDDIKVRLDTPDEMALTKITVSEVIDYKTASGNTMPILAITDGTLRYYVMPFRKYCMSVNSRIDGDGMEYASTHPIPFKELIVVPAIMKAEYIRTSTATVLTEFAHRQDAMLDIKTRFDWTPNEVFHNFIKKVFEYVWPNDKWPYIV